MNIHVILNNDAEAVVRADIIFLDNLEEGTSTISISALIIRNSTDYICVIPMDNKAYKEILKVIKTDGNYRISGIKGILCSLEDIKERYNRLTVSHCYWSKLTKIYKDNMNNINSPVIEVKIEKLS